MVFNTGPESRGQWDNMTWNRIGAGGMVGMVGTLGQSQLDNMVGPRRDQRLGDEVGSKSERVR